jgi:broad specificity phosphatase PhoE
LTDAFVHPVNREARRCQNPQVRKKLLRLVAALYLGAFAIGTPAATAAPDEVITLTLVRHAETEANAAGLLDTIAPGSSLTAKGAQQAKDAAQRLSLDDPDGVFASSLVRTQQTAQYLADETSLPVAVVPGLSEIGAGLHEGHPQAIAGPALFGVVNEWLNGNTETRIPGAENGIEFLDRFSGAVREISTTGDQRPVAFSHGAAIAVWTLMSVSNPRFELFASQPLPNTGYVVVQGNPTVGWKLIDWNGTQIG